MVRNDPSHFSDTDYDHGSKRGSKKMIMIVEDDAVVGSALERAARAGHSAVVIPSGMEALSLMHLQMPRMMIIDLGLPGLDGIGVLRAIRKDRDYDRMPVVIYSGEFSDVARREALAAGAQDFIVKGTVGVEAADSADYSVVKGPAAAAAHFAVMNRAIVRGEPSCRYCPLDGLYVRRGDFFAPTGCWPDARGTSGVAGEFVDDVLAHGVAGGRDRGDCEERGAVVVVIVAPGKNARRLGVADEGEDFDVPFEDDPAVEGLLEGDRLEVDGAASVLAQDVVLERPNVVFPGHAPHTCSQVAQEYCHK